MLIGTKWPKVSQHNLLHTITAPPPSRTVDTGQDGSMLSSCLLYCLNVAAEIETHPDQATFLQSSIVLFW